MNVIEKTDDTYLTDLVSMALALWPDNDREGLTAEFRSILHSEKDNIFICKDVDQAIAFMHVSLRQDYVEGSDSSPVAYVEGVYVKPAYRRQGVSGKLLQAAERWARDRGCNQIGSDIEFGNEESYQFHIRSGFKEVSRNIHLIKDLTSDHEG